MKEINFYKDNINEQFKGYVSLNSTRHGAELTVSDNTISIRIFDFNKKLNRKEIDIFSLHQIIFHCGITSYLLFGLDFKTCSFMKLGHDESFDDFSYSAKGFLHTKLDLSRIHKFTGISIHAEKLKAWAGNTRKLDAVIACGLNNTQPNPSDLVEFKKKIKGFGSIGLYYSYVHGGLEGLHTVGMSISPHIILEFENDLVFTDLLEQYIDLYTLLRFVIGNNLELSIVTIFSDNDFSNTFERTIQLYLPEKRTKKPTYPTGILIPYSSMYQNGKEDIFPHMIWDYYYNQDLRTNRALLKKFVSYSMISSTEEMFLGFYRIIETITMKKSCFVEEEKLSVFLNKARGILSKTFPNSSISDFIRAIKRANKSKNNTEKCIRQFIKNLPPHFTESIGLKQLPINKICLSRNNIIHQPLFSESPEKIYKHMQITEALTILALLIELGVTMEKIEEISFSHGWQNVFKYT